MTKDFPALRMKIERGHLVPAGSFDAERIDSYRNGTVVQVRFTEEKVRPAIKRWFSVLGLVLKQCKTPWKNKDEAHEAIKLALGIVNLSKTVGGEFMQYPKSLQDLEDPELEEALEQMITLLSRMTGVDVATLKKESDKAVASEVVEESTSLRTMLESLMPESDGPSPSDPADAVPPSASAEAGGAPPPLPASPDPERDTLIRYASDILPMAAEKDMTLDALKVVDKEWAIELKTLSETAIETARSINKSSRHVFNNPEKLNGLLGYWAGALGTTVEELRGAA